MAQIEHQGSLSSLMRIEILRGGLLTTVQDRGREGWRRYGVPRSGALDLEEAVRANFLVGNDPGDGVLEATIDGPTLGFPNGGLIAICGADAVCSVNGMNIPTRHPVALPPKCVLEIGRVRSGCRIYIAVAGGIDVPVLLGSRSTCLRAGFGGHEGRALRSGDVLPVGSLSSRSLGIVNHLTSDGGAMPCVGNWRAMRPGRASFIRFFRGEEYPLLDDEGRGILNDQKFVVDRASDRMGLRLRARPIHLVREVSIQSRAVLPGTIQLPPDGMPIILLADAGTTGGYPVIGYVMRNGLSDLGQIREGEEVRMKDEG